jgi:hypothetical protein
MNQIYIHSEGLHITISIKGLTFKELDRLIKQWAVTRDVYQDLSRLFDNPRTDCGKMWWQRSYHQQRGFYRSKLSKVLNRPLYGGH